MAWYDEGFVEPEKTSYNPDQVYRFYLPEDKSTEITFVDDIPGSCEFTTPEGKKVKLSLPIVYKEHQLHLNGSWRNWFTCTKPLGKPCSHCNNGEKASQVAALTVIDHSEWTDKSGKVHKDEKKLYVVKTSSETYKIIQKQAEKRGGLRGCRFEVSRFGDKSPNVGNNFDFIRKDQIQDTVFNYLEILAPKSEKEMEKIQAAVAAEEESPVPF